MTEYLLIDALMNFIRASTTRFADTLDLFLEKGRLSPAAIAERRRSIQGAEEWRGKTSNTRPTGGTGGDQRNSQAHAKTSAGLSANANPTTSSSACSTIGEKPLFLVNVEVDSSGVLVTPSR
ncbi:dynein heavy chain family related [Cystoisospora suis]|uniref:Dynein heavy chain family related n=1 Tax=Cystoisospora suis TaxID=483139 RepID=A0A2C6KLA3_9APIC|nr:dynein heavy chain family related [Cystoisospora suis]